MNETAKQIKDKFFELGVDIPIEDIEERLNKLITKFRVPVNEARRSVINYFLKEHNIARSDYFTGQSEQIPHGESPQVNTADISKADMWVSVKGKIVQLWDNDHDSISQVGLIGDETGTIKFTKWQNAELPDMEEGKCYLFKNMISKEWNGRINIDLNKNTSIEELDMDIDIDVSGPSTESPQVNTADILEADRWISVRGKIVQLWDNDHDSISQVGLIGDESGTIKFTNWQSAELPDVEEGKCYLFKNVMSKEWNGRINIDLNKNTSIEELDMDIDIDVFGPSTESPQVKTADILEADRWISVRGKIVQLWDNDHDSISQVGLIGDESGTIKFTNWQSAELPDVKEGKCYLFSNVVSNEWNGRINIDLNKNTSIEEIDEDIEVGTSDTTFTGALVDIQSGSGLIKRCPECKRSLTKGACTEHGKVEGLYDLRIKAVMDDGVVTQEALLNRELTEQVGELTLDDAISMAADALDQGVVLDGLKKKLVGKYYTVIGPKMDRYILVDSIEQESQVDTALINDLLTKVEVA